MIDAASLESAFLFWLAILGCGLLAWPLAATLLSEDDDLGYFAAKPLGWLIGGYAAWMGAYAGIPFWRYGWLVGIAALVAVCAIGLARLRPTRLLPVARLLQWEVGFLALLMLGVLIKGSAADIAGLEKFMDFGFVNAALRATTMPPPDPWWAGEPINYYVFGHVAAAWLIQVSGVPADHGFNLMIATLFAFVATLAYRIVEGCLLKATGSRVAQVCGAAAAAIVTLGGNFHSVLYGPFRAFSPTTYTRDFFYPDSTRFVGFDPPTMDKGFTEMPGYGFAVGDLHAHLLNLPAAFLILLILARILQRETGPEAIGRLRPAEIGMLAFLFAVSAMCNTWDVLSYGIMMLIAGFAIAAWAGRRWLRRLLGLAATGAVIALLSMILVLPFVLSFKPISSQFRWSDGHTPAWQLAVIYGHVALPCLILVLGLTTRLRKNPAWQAGALLAMLAMVLVTLPEIAFVKDIYGEDHRRANTMFKFTFEAQPIAAMASMIAVGLLLRMSRAGAVLALLLATPPLATLAYGENIYRSRIFPLRAHQFTLAGYGYLERDRPDDVALVRWLRAQPPDRHILLVEAPGDSFTQDSRLSAMSGVPVLVGWRGHERLWRGDVALTYGRGNEVTGFYNSSTRQQACDFVLSKGVTHVAIGTVERERFPNLKLPIFEALGRIVVQSGNSLIVSVDADACKG